MSRHLTLSIVSSVPYSNLNRDDSGTPKRATIGGSLRALHSSQSIKRGIRVAYENASLDCSVRSGSLSEDVVAKALAIQPDADEKALTKEAKKIIGSLTKKDKNEKEGDSERSSWLSEEELTTAAYTVLGRTNGEFIEDGRTGSLAIAAFGRMFAGKSEKTTEAALSVSPGVTTHPATIETDYFSTADDIKERKGKTGATYLGVAQYTNGIFYRTVSIDREQLKKSWAGFGQENSKENLRQLITAILYGMPRGKENSTAPYVQPALVLAEEQQYRTAYDFETPVKNGAEGGYLGATIDELAQQYAAARRFDPDNFGPVESLTGTYTDLDGKFGDLKAVSRKEFVENIVEWICQ
ncbi:type I-E CRISPR-associated protein Cas7/Cse4/CasC [Rothia sp. CCM 9418]|uniref:type I-E CRISPR-associated protein Cas7/Cse4/CasC n=1 Tax=Rothia sp. CCM 9418 TaxID=3402661 RepID=UPI003AEE53DA